MTVNCGAVSGALNCTGQAVDLLPRETLYKAEATRVARQFGASSLLHGPLPECPARAGIVLLSCRGPISYSCGREVQLQFMLCDLFLWRPPAYCLPCDYLMLAIHMPVVPIACLASPSCWSAGS